MVDIAFAILLTVSATLTIQAAASLYMMIYTWDQPSAGVAAQAPETFTAPEHSFTVLLPARHEEKVIQNTIRRIAQTNYPSALLQIIVICSADDTSTIDRAEAEAAQLRDQGFADITVAIFSDGPVNKPHGLNVGLTHAHHDIVCIFDAEDDLHPDIFLLINTLFVRERPDVVQAGVQLMNYRTNWYSAINVLEYFFWFKSRLHFHARHGSIPLGGNTVFFRHELLAQLGGWDETILTEDAEIGIRLSTLGATVRVVYDDRYVTREETPPTLGHFLRQRTRWSQGFIQTLRKGTWKQMPTRRQRFLAFYTLAFTHMQAALGIYVPISLLMIFLVNTPVQVALVSYLPVLMLAAHFTTSMAGLYEFTDAHHLQANWRMVLKLALAWYPYQLILAYAAVRAFRRQMAHRTDWEKTRHVGAHRTRTEHLPDHAH
jgi:cellulose synthase/poly-beta-1,6-N-acetylglucosamine synthase-like glycosyltransferase